MIVLACQFLIGLVFVAAVAGKVTGYRAFVESVRDLGLEPATRVAAAVLAAETAVAGLVAVAPRAGFVVAAILLLAFAGAVVRSLRHGGGRPCRCFGRSTMPLDWHHVWRNAFLIAVAVVGGLTTPSAVSPATAAEAAVIGLMAGGLVVSLDDLRFLFAGPGDATRTPR